MAPAAVGMVVSPVSSGTHPEPGRQTLGECGWLAPARWDWNHATNKPADWPCGWFIYVRLNRRSAWSCAVTAASIGSSRSNFHWLNSAGKREISGGAGGCSLPATQCDSSPWVNRKTGASPSRQSNVVADISGIEYPVRQNQGG